MSAENYLCYCMYLVSNLSIIIHRRFSKCTKNNIQKCKSGLAVLSIGLIHIGMEKWHKVLSELEQTKAQSTKPSQAAIPAEHLPTSHHGLDRWDGAEQQTLGQYCWSASKVRPCPFSVFPERCHGIQNLYCTSLHFIFQNHLIPYTCPPKRLFFCCFILSQLLSFQGVTGMMDDR